MKLEVTPKMVEEFGKIIGDSWKDYLDPQDRKKARFSSFFHL